MGLLLATMSPSSLLLLGFCAGVVAGIVPSFLLSSQRRER